MAENEKKTPAQHNRKHLVGRAREQRLSKMLVIGTAAILVIVVGLVSWVFIQQKFIDPNKTVAVVEGEAIKGEEFQTRVRFIRQQYVNQYLQYLQLYTLYSGDNTYAQQFLNQLSTIQFQLLPSQVGSATLSQMIDDKLILLEAKELGITASEEEIDQQIEAIFAYYPDGTPTAAPSSTPFATSTLSATQYALVSPTPTSSPIPTSDAATAAPSATPETEPTAAEEITPEPTPTAYTFEGYQADYADYLENTLGPINWTEQDLRDLVRINIISTKLYESLTDDMPTVADQVWARHILVADEETAQNLYAELRDGTDWDTLALNNSLDTSNSGQGGDLGWFSFDEMVEPFATAAFATPVGSISEPVQSSFGWHLIQVLGHEERPMDQTTIDQLKSQVYNDYVAGLRDKYEWEIKDDAWLALTPDKPDIDEQYKLTTAQ